MDVVIPLKARGEILVTSEYEPIDKGELMKQKAIIFYNWLYESDVDDVFYNELQECFLRGVSEGE